MASPASAAHPLQKTSLSLSGNPQNEVQECEFADRRNRPLSFLELPLDVLELIVKEVTNTNDLAALALTNSVLYNLSVPHIYSRFDIVWPDSQIGTSDSKSVDALTYGLSTLCIGSAFARTVTNSRRTPGRQSKLIDDHAQYTRKFSLGNGPSDWVAEYAVHKESGKMLGTLVAHAIARMKNLESFFWDMPTGVLSRVFEALASLGHQPDNECKLNRVWVRWHDNNQRPTESGVLDPNDILNGTALVPQGSQLTPVGIMLPSNAVHPPPRPPVRYSEYHCEYPTFSVLPPLKSLNVLDVDEIGYLDEMAVLIERSKDTLQELRVGISAKAATHAFAQTWDGRGLKQVDHQARWPGESTIGERRLGGVLGVLVGRIYDIRKGRVQDKPAPDPPAAGTTPSTSTAAVAATAPAAAQAQVNEEPSSSLEASSTPSHKDGSAKTRKPKKPHTCHARCRKRLEGKLKLQLLGLERVVLSLQVCRFAIDWSVLTSLTLLDCAQNDNFWKMLRKQFEPTAATTIGVQTGKQAAATAPLEYHLALKSIHTDSVTMSLMQFLKETLAPNSLEVLFLQDRKRTTPALPLDTVKLAIKRHRTSLRKLLLDSTAKGSSDNIRWRQWALSTDMLLYITSGRMPNLRELAVSLQHKDWHTFLQRLPHIPHLRSLNIPHLADHPARILDAREVALQILDIVAVRPEVRLCYVGVGPKCFEILETRQQHGDDGDGSGDEGVGGVGGVNGGGSGTLSASTSGASTPVTPAPAAPAAAGVVGVGVGGAALAGAVAAGGMPMPVPMPMSMVVPVLAPPPQSATAAGGLGGGVHDDLEPDSISDEEEDADNEAENENENEDGDGNGNGPAAAAVAAAGENDSEAGDAGDGAAGGAGGVGGAGDATPPTTVSDAEGAGTATSVEGDGDSDDDDEGFVELGKGGVGFKLREILFYDDKVAIFKARHARL